MKAHPLIVFALASVAIAQVPTPSTLTEDSLVILNICERNALAALKIGQLFPDVAQYEQGYADALRDAQKWLPDYLPHVPGFVPVTPPPADNPPRFNPPHGPRQPNEP